AGKNEIALPGDVACRRDPGHTGGDYGVHLPAVDVEDVQLVSSARERPRHAAAHDAETDDADARLGAHAPASSTFPPGHRIISAASLTFSARGTIVTSMLLAGQHSTPDTTRTPRAA